MEDSLTSPPVVEATVPETPPRPRGFALLSHAQMRTNASAGGKRSHQLGVAHKFTPEEARAAGHVGGVTVSQNREHMRAIGRLGGKARHGAGT